MSRKRYSFLLSVALVMASACVSGRVVLCDFETDADTLPVSKTGGCGKSWSGYVTNHFATSGRNGYYFSGIPWKKGLNEWPGFSLKELPVKDWCGYDRLVFDVTSIGNGGDWLTVFCLGPTGGVSKALKDSRRIPAHGCMQYVVSLEAWPKSVSPANIAGLHFFVQRPKNGFALVLDRFMLLKKGEPLPVPDSACVWRDIVPMVVADRNAWRDMNDGDIGSHKSHMRDYFRFRESCERDRPGMPFLLGTASSMTQILPRGAFEARPIPEFGLRVRLARNEYESVQIVVAPKDDDLKNVGVRLVGDLCSEHDVFSATNIECAVVGYVKTKESPPYEVGFNVATNSKVGYLRQTRKPMVGWWPDPILGFIGECDVSGSDVQSFWVRVRCPERQAAGVYRGDIEIFANGIDPVRVPFSVRVNDFALGRVSQLPLAVTFGPKAYGVLDQASTCARQRNPDAPVNKWKRHMDAWVDFLADYLITFDHLYHFDNASDETGNERLRALKRLNDQGRLGWFNIGHWWRNPDHKNAGTIDAWRKQNIPRLVDFYEAVKKLGIVDKAYAYGCDEFPSKSFLSVREAAHEVRKALPDVPVFTTTFDREFGVGTMLSEIDWFCPGTRVYVDKLENGGVEAARKEGRKVWWYVCDGPCSPWANLFIECPAIEGRLLMGAQAVRMRPDGFLYYQISKWNSDRCIEAGPFTDWDPRSHKTWHGDGALTCAGPDGTPLPTIRLENFRDGLEDYAYAMILERKLNGHVGKSDAWSCRARELLSVPYEVMDTMTNFTDDPAALYRWRDEMADLIESCVRRQTP
ncbi:MAG: DUF4091 domain-containing protein [Kiritimatiellae bacterium]|nr:DUF4091 domain-containing protein [Kiritimatiellia bacterium]